jgi:WD40 repeat protein/serine/threonine protein kinase
VIEDLTHQVVKGYELREPIGEGGYGIVYRAYQPLVGRDVAVKIILPQHANHPEFIRRFESEAQLVARIEHPYIVPLYDYWRDPEGAYLVMRYLRGGSLRTLLQSGPLPIVQFDRLMEQIGGALAAAHRRGVVHRDLKPANILLDEDGNTYLADFGIAKDIGKQVSPFQTDQHAVVGSPAYLAPEQVKAEEITPQTDLYSFGVLVYEILTGQLPFHAPTPIALMFKHLNEPVPSICEIRTDLPNAVDMVIQRATAKQPAGRYPDVLTMVRELRQALAQTAGAIMPPGPSRPTIRLDNNDDTSAGRKTRSKYETGLIETPIELRPVEEVLENPYKGLRPFQEADAADFFGREMLSQLLLARMQESSNYARFLAVVGPSGSGKSSVVRAGLIPALKRGALLGSENWFVLEMFPGAHPIEELAQALLRIAVDPPNNLVGPLRLDDAGLMRVIDRVVPGGSETEVVLVIDQFEELFTLVEDATEIRHFLDTIITAVTDPSSRLRVIVTLRADFYDRPLLYARFSELMRARTEVVGPLAEEELKAAIVNPAERNGLHVDPDLVNAIVSDVGAQPGALPLLQYALTEVFARRSGRTLTLTPYHASGGVLGALARRAEDLYTSLAPAQQEAARQLFLRLVTLGEGVEDTRRRVRRMELVPVGGGMAALDTVIEIYAQYRLLTLDRDLVTRAPTVEVAHEALIRTWTRLRGWLDASREDVRLHRWLSAAAADWAGSEGDPSFLVRGQRLAQLDAWAAETPLALNAEEQAYLEASLSAEAARHLAEETRKAHEVTLEQRSRLFLRALVGVFAVAAVIAVILSFVAFQQQRLAQQNAQRAFANEELAQRNAATAVAAQGVAQQEANTRATAEAQVRRQLTVSTAERLALQALYEISYSPETALLLAYEAVSLDHTSTAEQALHATVDNLVWQPTVLRGHTDLLKTAVFSPDEQRILTASEDGTARLWDLAGNQLAVFKGHDGNVLQARFSLDGQRVLTASQDGTARLWDLTGKQLVVFEGHKGNVNSAEFSPDGQRIITTSRDRTARLWDLSGKQLRLFQGHTNIVRDPVFSPDGRMVVTASDDGTARIWNLFDEQSVVLDGHDGQEVESAVFSPNGQQVLTAAKDDTARLWDLAGKQLAVFKGHTRDVNAAIFSPDGEHVVTASVDRTARLWDLAGNELVVFEGHSDIINSVRFSPDGKSILTFSHDKTARLWDLSGKQRAVFSHTGRVTDALVSSDGRHILTASEDHTARVWEMVGPPLPAFGSHTDLVVTTTYSPDGKYILTASRDGLGRLWDLSGRLLVTFEGHTGAIIDAEFSPDGQRILTSSEDGTARLWDLSGKQLAKFDSHADFVEEANFSPDGQRVLTANSSRTAQLWDLSGKPLALLSGHEDEVNSVAFSPDGQRILTASDDKTARLWDLSGNELVVFEGHTDPVGEAVFSPDGRHVLTDSEDFTAKLWDLTGKELVTFKGHEDRLLGVRFSPDGQRVLTESLDQTARLWDLSGQQLAIFPHSGAVVHSAFSPDGQRILTGSRDQTARLWTASGKLLATFPSTTGIVNRVSFSPDGRQILAGSQEGTVRQYLADVDDLLAVAACRIGRELTKEEIQSFDVGQPHFALTNRQCPPARS